MRSIHGTAGLLALGRGLGQLLTKCVLNFLTRVSRMLDGRSQEFVMEVKMYMKYYDGDEILYYAVCLFGHSHGLIYDASGPFRY
jgi:hypothetical protein